MRAVKWGPLVFSADTCGDLLVTLQSLSRQGEKRSLQLSGKVNSMTFTFDSVLPGKYKSKTLRASHGPYMLPVFLSVLKPSSQIASQLSTFTCLTLLWPLTLNVLYLASGNNAGAEALGTNCHLIRTTHPLLFWEGPLIHAILFLNAVKEWNNTPYVLPLISSDLGSPWDSVFLPVKEEW